MKLIFFLKNENYKSKPVFYTASQILEIMTIYAFLFALTLTIQISIFQFKNYLRFLLFAALPYVLILISKVKLIID